MLHEGLDAFIYPFCHYVVQELAIADRASVSTVVEQRLTSFLDSRLLSKAPQTGEALRRIAAEFNNAKEEQTGRTLEIHAGKFLKIFFPNLPGARSSHSCRCPKSKRKGNC